VSVVAPALELALPEQRLRDSFALLAKNKLALVGAVISVLFLLGGIAGLVVLWTPSLQHLYKTQDLEHTLVPPFSPGHLLGTDNFGEDTAWRILAGLGISLGIGIAVTGLSIVFGMIVGTAAGFVGGKLDAAIRAVLDLVWGFPLLLVAVIVVGVMGPGLPAVIVAVALVNWAGFARIIRAETVSIRQQEFVEAARALGVPRSLAIARHVIPNTIGSTLVMSTYYIAQTVIIEAGLSFIGLGAQFPTPSLGQLIYNGTQYMYNDVWLPVVPGVVITLIVLGFNTLGDGLRDIFDPRSRRS
jgi:peptide/nickel transport system permease protein